MTYDCTLTDVTGGFSVIYFQIKWVSLNGAGIVFGLQSLIVGFFIISIIWTQISGPAWRKKYPAPLTSRTT
jgi:hypothetical protein